MSELSDGGSSRIEADMGMLSSSPGGAVSVCGGVASAGVNGASAVCFDVDVLPVTLIPANEC